MAVTINFNTLTASTNNLGKIGEHNSTELQITYTNSDERCSQYRIAFATGKEVILSETFTEMPINIYLWQQLTKCPRISIQVICYDDDGEYISKSAKMSGFYFEPSIGNTTVEADGSNPDMAGEITDLDTRLTSAEADIDELDEGKQSKITASNKLPYSLISGTPTIPTIPTNVSAFTNDAGYLTEHQDISGKQDKIDSSHKLSASLVDGLSTVATSGSYTDLSNKPTIPDVSGKADKSYVDTQLLYKQDKLTAGENITITEEGVISAEGGSSSYDKYELVIRGTSLYHNDEVVSFDDLVDICNTYNAYVVDFSMHYVYCLSKMTDSVIEFCNTIKGVNYTTTYTVTCTASGVSFTQMNNTVNAYTKSETDVLLNAKADASSVPSATKQAEWDAKLDASAITNLVDKTDDVATEINDDTTTTLLPNVSAVKGYVDAHTSSSRLPAEYQEVEYIESTGTQYIDTEFIASNYSSIYLDCMPINIDSWDYPRMFGAFNTAHEYYAIHAKNSSNEPTVFIPFIETLESINIPSNNVRLKIKHQIYYHNYFNCNGTEIQYTPFSYYQGTMNAYIFCVNRNNEMFRPCPMRLYECKLSGYINNADIFVVGKHFIPCYRRADNVIGLYDIIGDRFYTNQGTGTFLKGADV